MSATESIHHCSNRSALRPQEVDSVPLTRGHVSPQIEDQPCSTAESSFPSVFTSAASLVPSLLVSPSYCVRPTEAAHARAATPRGQRSAVPRVFRVCSQPKLFPLAEARCQRAVSPSSSAQKQSTKISAPSWVLVRPSSSNTSPSAHTNQALVHFLPQPIHEDSPSEI